MNYFVFNHHDFWKWPQSNVASALDADIIFMWADWPFKDQVDIFKALGKKVITYEHGFGALSDYTLNNRQPCSHGYLALGRHSKRLLKEAGVPSDKILVTGSPVFQDVVKREHAMGKKALFVALHWVSDRTEYNNRVFKELREAYPEFEWTVKLNDKTGFDEGNYKVWKSNTALDVIDDVKEHIHEYDLVFTPRFSTFEMIATLAGLPVYITDEEESYRIDGDPKRYPAKYTYLRIGDKLPRQVKYDWADEISTAPKPFEKILEWCESI